MSNTARVLLTLAIVAAVIVVGIFAFLWGRGARAVDRIDEVAEVITGEGEFTRLGPVTVQTVRGLADLTTVEMVQYTTVEKGNDRGWLNWAAGERIAMFAVARIGAGVDLEQLEEDDVYVDPEAGKAIIRLPEGKITYVAVDNEATNVYDRDTGLFTKGDPNLERAARLAAEEILTNQAIESGLLETAESRAADVLTEFITSLGYTDVEVVVAP